MTTVPMMTMPPWGMQGMGMPGMQQPESSSSSEEEVPTQPGQPSAPAAPVAGGSAALVAGGAEQAAQSPQPSVPFHLSHPAEMEEFATMIKRSATSFKSLGRKWLSEIVEQLDSAFEASLTAELSNQGLLALIYLMTRMKPGLQITSLRFLAAGMV